MPTNFGDRSSAPSPVSVDISVDSIFAVLFLLGERLGTTNLRFVSQQPLSRLIVFWHFGKIASRLPRSRRHAKQRLLHGQNWFYVRNGKDLRWNPTLIHPFLDLDPDRDSAVSLHLPQIHCQDRWFVLCA